MNDSQSSFRAVPSSSTDCGGVPRDWQWVQRLLESQGIEVSVPDLPSHRRVDAGLLDDVEEVKRAIHSLRGPTVVVGWSYGCDVAAAAADGEENVARLVYVSSVPQPVQPDEGDGSFLDENPVII